MKSLEVQPTAILVGERQRVSALAITPTEPRAGFVFAHGAGAGMTHPFMEATATALRDVGIATLRFQFPYMESRSRRPDPPALCHATIVAAVAEASRLWKDVPLIAGGRSFGGRMSSQAQAKSALPGVIGLAFLGFPLHPANRPADERAQHLFGVGIPMLFLQGTRDELADLALLRALVDRLGPRATLKLTEEANHSFQVPARSGRRSPQIIAQLVEVMRDWIDRLIGHNPSAERSPLAGGNPRSP